MGYGYEYQGAGEPNPPKHQMKRALAVLRRFWLLILVTTALLTSLVFLYEARKRDFYVANARVQVNNEMNPALSGSGGGGSIVLNPGADPAYFATQLRILEGSGLLRRVVKALDLEHNEAFRTPTDQLSTWQSTLRMVGLYDPPPIRREAIVPLDKEALGLTHETEADLDRETDKLAPFVDAIQGGLTVLPVKETRTASKETRMIEVSFRHGDPVVAAKVANTIADIYVLQNLERKVESNTTASAFLDKRVAELQNQIRSLEERLVNYSKDNQIISLDSGQNTVVQRLADLNSKLGMAESERISAEAAYIAAKKNPMSDMAAETADPRTAGLENQLSALRQQLAQLKTEFTDEWPEVKRVQRQIVQIENELQTNRKRAKDTQGAMLEQKYREALAKERELRDNFNTQRNAVLAQNEAAINYRIIQQEIDSNRTLLSSLLSKSRETDVILNGTPNNVLVADRASVPQSPSGPDRVKNVLLAFLASLFVGVGMAFTLNSLTDKLRTFDDVEEKVGLPVIGRIPGIHQSLLTRALSSIDRLAGSDGGTAILPANFDRPIVAEALNEVRASLLLSADGEKLRTILVTSGEAGEGKSLTSFNLAKCLAQLGERVLLIDADLRRPQLHQINGIANDSGLTSLLTSEVTSQENIDLAIAEEVSANLDLMTAGPAVSDPATLLSLSRLQDVLRLLETTYRYIVIDSSPALYFADSVLLARVVDSALVVGRMNYSSTELLNLCTKKLLSVNANVVGLVLNDIPMKEYGYGRNGYYQNYASTNGHSNGNGAGPRMLDLG